MFVSRKQGLRLRRQRRRRSIARSKRAHDDGWKAIEPFIAGVLHWIEDTYFDEHTPVIVAGSLSSRIFCIIISRAISRG